MPSGAGRQQRDEGAGRQLRRELKERLGGSITPGCSLMGHPACLQVMQQSAGCTHARRGVCRPSTALLIALDCSVLRQEL